MPVEELRQLKQRMSQERPVPWDALPDLALYMDQLIAYLPRQLIRFEEGDALTPAMVNNYSKDGLFPRSQGKRYDRTHLAYLTAICALKQVLSVKEMKTLLQAEGQGKAPEELYGDFCRELDRALGETAQGLEEDLPQEELPRLALRLALRSYVDKLACQRVLSLLSGEGEEVSGEKKKDKKRDKERENRENDELSEVSKQ
jgi:hypothetical protein